MDVRCDKCQARYRIDDARVGPSGLTMRCGKCGNTFKVTKDSAAPSAPPAAKPAPTRPPEPAANATMVFGAPVAKAAPAAAPKPPPAAEGAGSTMMFGTSPVAAKHAPAAAPKPPPAAARPQEDSGSTMVFGTAPVVPVKPPTPMPKAAPARPPLEGAGSTMVFGASPLAKPPPPAAPKPPPPAPPKPAPAAALAKPAAEAPAEEGQAPIHVEGQESPTEDGGDDDSIPTAHAQQLAKPGGKIQVEADEARAAGHDEMTAPGKKPAPKPAPSAEPQVARPGEAVGEDDVDQSAMTGEEIEPPPAPAPSKGLSRPLIIGIGAAVAAVLLVLVGLVVVKKMGPKPPPEAAVQALEQGRALLEKDSLALFPQALETTMAALAAAPKSTFGEAHAIHAEIEIAWSDALTEQSGILEDRAQKADDDKKKAEAQAAADKAKADAKAHLTAALEAAKAGAKADPKSADLSVALADYYRAAHSNSNLTKELKKAASLKADEAKVALVEGLRLLGDDDGAEKALPKLKAAQAASPQSARIQFRIAQALLAMKNEPEAQKALQETLKLSPTHERAKAALEALQAAQQQGGGEQK